MRRYWVSVNGGDGNYIEAEDWAGAVAWATFMRGDVVTLSIEDHTEEEVCP